MWRVWRTIFVLRLPMIKIAQTHNNRVLTITLASPQNHNALTSESISRLRDACHQAQDKQAIFLNSSVEGYFCLGMDLAFLDKEMASASQLKLIEKMNDYTLFLKELINLPCLLVAEVDGLAVGGGVDILGGCDLVIASDSSVFSIAQLRKQVFPFTTSAMLIPIMNKNPFLFWLLSGQNYNAKKLHALGLITQVVAQDQLKDRSQQLLEQILSYDDRILKLGIGSIRQSHKMKQEEYLTYLGAQLAHSCRIRSEQKAK